MCTCQKPQRHLRANLLAGEAKATRYEGRPHLVVPVIMARSDVVMNDGIIPAEELVPWAWNGVPVTVGHPKAATGESIIANDPAVLTDWSVGRIFNARVESGILKADAWIDIARAERVYPGLVKQLQAGAAMDVSTGYFCDADQQAGSVGGRDYKEIHRNLRPEHLALLPDEEGACGWQDGCGVRSNLGRAITMKVNDAVAALRKAVDGVAMVLRTNSKANKRGSDDDHRQMIADLISSDDSPFTPEDEDSLRMMSRETLTAMRDAYIKREEPEPKKDDEPEPGEDEDEEKKEMKANAAMKAAVNEAVQAAVAEALKANALSDDDKAALADARQARAQRKVDLVARVVANSSITKEAADKMDFATLETVANGLLPVANYGARAVPAAGADKDDPAVKAMTENSGVVALIRNKTKAA